ncbi:MAG: hypothetical protein ABL908_07965 [Hyphomicrobium sp.]
MIEQGVCTQFKLDLLRAVHNFETDTFMVALYIATASLGPSTAVYTTAGEIAGPGYMGGGRPLTVSAGYPAVVGNTGGARFDDAIWTGASFSADGALIYNASKGNKAIMALGFPSTKRPTTGRFELIFPVVLAPLVQVS